MDDTTSDPGTFVSIENFVTSAAPSPEPFSRNIRNMTEDNARDEFAERASFSTAPQRDTSFMWNLFDNPGGDDSQGSQADASEANRTEELSAATEGGSNAAPREGRLIPVDDDDDDVSNGDGGTLDEGDTMTDASDLCVEIDKLISPSLPTPRGDRQSSSHLSTGRRSARKYDLSPDDADPSEFPSDSEEAPLWADASADSLRASFQSAREEVSIAPAAPQSPFAKGNDTPAAPSENASVDTTGVDESASDNAAIGDAADTFKQAIEEDNKRLLEATSGLTSFEIDNPFVLSSAEPDERSSLILFSKKGPWKQDEKSAFETLATQTSAQSMVFARMVETIVFQREQLSNLKNTAVELTGNALHSETQRFSEVERRRSYAMNALIGELDVERGRFSKIERENMFLRQQLSTDGKNLDAIVAYCKQFDSDFSLAGGVESAFESIFARNETRRQSVEQVALQSTQMEELASRLLKLDKLVGESRTRSDELEAENIDLRAQLASVEGASQDVIVDTPEPSPRLPTPRDSPLHVVIRERDELNRKLQEQAYQLDTVREYLQRSAEEKKKVNDALLSLNVDMEMARSKINTLQTQRDTAEREWREVEKQRSIDRKTYHEMCQELSHNIVEAVNDIDEKESSIRLLTKEIEDRESVIQSLQVSVSEFEDQLANLTEAALRSSQSVRSAPGKDDKPVAALVDGVMKTLRAELSSAQNILVERSNEVSELKKRVATQDEVTFSLRRECDRYRAVAAMKTTALEPAVGREINTEEQQNSFLERLSETLGCRSENNHELVGKLISRVEELLRERSGFENSAVKLRSEVLERERTLHVVRSEMQAEISALKAEVQYLENLKRRAVEQCDFAENKVMELLGERDCSNASSCGDITASSLGTRRQSGFSLTDNLSRRESMISAIGADNSIQWNDPLVAAAIQSLDQLTDMKDRLAARYRALRERLDRMIRRAEATGASGDAKALMIESRELQEDLSGVVNMQQQIIDKLRPQRSFGSSVPPRTDDTLPYIGHGGVLEKAGGVSNIIDYSQGDQAGQAVVVSSSRFGSKSGGGAALAAVDDAGEAAGFLRDQLKQTRELYNEKSKANAQLCGVVAELKQELEHVIDERRSTEDFLSQVSDNHASFVSRLAEITGTEESPVAIEDHVRYAVQDLGRVSAGVSILEKRSLRLLSMVMQLVAQKHVLSHMIDTYQSKYQLDILMPSPQEASSPRRRFRIFALAVVAGVRMLQSAKQVAPADIPEIDISEDYQVPGLAPIARRRSDGMTLVNASVALSAIPRLEAALLERERKIEELSTALSALDNTSLPALPEDVRNAIQTSFVYEEDVVNRKQDLSRRLRKALKEKTELELRFSRERESRIAAEAKLSRYSEKLSNAKKRLNKVNSQADSKERTYKAAIKYLKHKADKAVENDFNIDENTDPWVRQHSPLKKNDENEGVEANLQAVNAKSLMILQTQIVRAESTLKNVEEGSADHQEVKKYIQGLHKAVNRLKQTRKAHSQGPTVVDSNLVADAC